MMPVSSLTHCIVTNALVDKMHSILFNTSYIITVMYTLSLADTVLDLTSKLNPVSSESNGNAASKFSHYINAKYTKDFPSYILILHII